VDIEGLLHKRKVEADAVEDTQSSSKSLITCCTSAVADVSCELKTPKL
jgi:hypothetical protein